MWRPGDPAPAASSGGGKKRKRKRKRRLDAQSEQQVVSKKEVECRGQVDEVDPGRVPEFVETSSKTPAIGSNPRSHHSSSSSLPEVPSARQLSSNLRGMKFMQRKEEQRKAASEEALLRRKLEKDKWVIDPGLIQSQTGQLFVEPLQIRPAPAPGRMSYGSFNTNVDAFNKGLKHLNEGNEESAKLDERAMDDEEMAAVLGANHKRKRGLNFEHRPGTGNSKKKARKWSAKDRYHTHG